MLSVRDRGDVFLLRLPCVILIIGLSSNSLALVDSVLLTLLGLRYFLLVSLLPIVVLTVVEIVVLPLSLYLGLGTEFAEAFSVLDLDVGGVYLLDPLRRELLGSLLLNVEVSAGGASTCSTDSSSATRLTGLVLDRTRPRNGLDGRVEFRDVILTLDLFDEGALVVVVVVVASDELNLRLVKPNGRGCETVAIVDLLADAIVVFVVVDEVVAGRVVSKISVAESSTSFTESAMESGLSTLGLTLIDGFSGGSTLITVKTSVEVEAVVVGVVDAKVVVLAVVLDCPSESSSSVVGEVVISSEDTLDKFSDVVVFEVVPLNLCTLLYLKDFGNNVNRIARRNVLR